ncbi:MAG: DUF2203 domain-containing protein [Deltaproteobacteria bacterium]|nr:DUF2203 domain-containing protein [Deltaproteobacteria bacterium]
MHQNVVELKKNRLFTLKEAQTLLPIIRKITRETIRQVEDLEWKTKFGHLLKDEHRLENGRSEIQLLIERWSDKVSRLGAEPKGFWLVDFNFGEGYFCWKYPEEQIGFFHDYQGGFSKRSPII